MKGLRTFIDYFSIFQTSENADDFALCEFYKVSKYLEVSMLAVHKDHRKRGIAKHFLQCIKAICKEFGVELASGLFINDASMKAAQNAGFKIDDNPAFTTYRRSIKYDFNNSSSHTNIESKDQSKVFYPMNEVHRLDKNLIICLCSNISFL